MIFCPTDNYYRTFHSLLLQPVICGIYQKAICPLLNYYLVVVNIFTIMVCCINRQFWGESGQMSNFVYFVFELGKITFCESCAQSNQECVCNQIWKKAAWEWWYKKLVKHSHRTIFSNPLLKITGLRKFTFKIVAF